MYFSTYYDSPIGKLFIVSDYKNIVGLWIEKQKYFKYSIKCSVIKNVLEKSDFPVLLESVKWLDDYFAKKNPAIDYLPLAPNGSPFRKLIWDILMEIPYGEVITYGAIAKEAARRMGRAVMSGQAVGGAVGHNPISIVIPCHRVIGANGNLTGYAGGIDIKIKLLEHEGVDTSKMFIPKK